MVSLSGKLVMLAGFLFVLPQAQGQSFQSTELVKDPVPPGALVRIGSIRWRVGTMHSPVYASALAPNGKSVYVGTDVGIREFDLESGLLVRILLGHDEEIYALALSPDGKLLASAGYKGTFLWDVSSGKQLRTLKVSSVAVMTFSPDGKKLITGGREHEHSVRILDLASNKEELRLLWHNSEVSLVACAPDGKTLITGSNRDSEIIHVTDITTGELMRTIKNEARDFSAAALSPDGKSLAVSSLIYQQKQPRWSQRVKLINLTTGKERSLLDSSQDDESSRDSLGLIFSPDGKSLVASIGKAFHVWDMAGDKVLRKFPGGGSRLYFAPTGKQLIVMDSVIRVWDFQSGKELHPPEGLMVGADSVALSPDGKTLASSSYGPSAGVRFGDQKSIKLWNASTGKPKGELKGHEGYLRSVEFAPNGQLVSGGGDSTLRVWDIEAAKEVFRFNLHEPPAGEEVLQVVTLCVAADGKKLAAAGLGFGGPGPPKEKIYQFLWNLDNGKLLARHEKAWSLSDWPAFSHDCNFVLEEAEKGLALKNVLTGKETLKLQPVPQPAGDATVFNPDILENPFTFSPDGRYVVVGSSRARKEGPRSWRDQYAIVLFDLATGKEIYRLPVDYWLTRVTISPDGKRLAVALRSSVRIWDVAGRKPIWETPNLVYRVKAMCFGADGNRLVTALENATILIWDVSSAKK